MYTVVYENNNFSKYCGKNGMFGNQSIHRCNRSQPLCCVSQFFKKRSQPLFLILQKYYSFVDTAVYNTTILTRAKHLKVFKTIVF